MTTIALSCSSSSSSSSSSNNNNNSATDGDRWHSRTRTRTRRSNNNNNNIRNVRTWKQTIVGIISILLCSPESVMGVVLVVLGMVVYIATKAYQRSLCKSLGWELANGYGRGGNNGGGVLVFCAMPGAVADTAGFQSEANMLVSLIFWILSSSGWV